MKVIGLVGNKRVGKTTTALILKEIYEKEGKQVEIISLADGIKELACAALNISMQDLETLKEKEDRGRIICLNEKFILAKTTGRKFLQGIGEGLKSITGNEFIWIELLVYKICKSEADIVIVPDIRFPYEAHYLKKTFDTKIIKIYRETGLVDTHISEAHAQHIKADYYIDNNGNSKTQLLEECLKIIRKMEEENEHKKTISPSVFSHSS